MVDEPSTTLAIDLSIRHGGLALLASSTGEVLHVRSELSGVGDLVGALRELVLLSGQAVSHVVATRGPGSYIGVRSGLAAAIGFAQARALPLKLLGSLSVVAATASPTGGELLVVVSAGRGGRYAQSFGWNGSEGPEAVVPLGEAVALAGTKPPPTVWPDARRVIDPDGVGGDLGLPLVEPIRLRADGLALLAVLGSGFQSGYDLVSADYGAPIGDISWS